MKFTRKELFSWKTILAIIFIVFLLIIPISNNRRVMNIAIISFIYIALGESWNIMAGLAGLFSVAHGVFFGLGVYATTIATNRFDIPFAISIPIGIGLNIIMAFIFGLIGSKLSGLYFTMALIGLQMVVYTITQQWNAFTGGMQGLAMPKQYLLSKPVLFWIALVLALLSMILFVIIRKSRIGTNLVALRENPYLAQVLGSNIIQWRVIATIISASMASVVGNFYALYMMSTNPQIFIGLISLKIIIVVLVGGIGGVWGPPLGTILIIGDELIRGAMPGKYAALSVVIYATVLIIIVMLKPTGLTSIRFKLPKVFSRQRKKNSFRDGN